VGGAIAIDRCCFRGEYEALVSQLFAFRQPFPVEYRPTFYLFPIVQPGRHDTDRFQRKVPAGWRPGPFICWDFVNSRFTVALSGNSKGPGALG